MSTKRIIWIKKNNQRLRLDSAPNTHINEGLFTLLKLIPYSCYYLPQKALLQFNIYYISYSLLLIKFSFNKSPFALFHTLLWFSRDDRDYYFLIGEAHFQNKSLKIDGHILYATRKSKEKE